MDLDDNSLILKYFSITEKQTVLFEKLGSLYREWNQKINLISRKDMEHLYLHHIVHSLSIAKLNFFANGTKIVDVGTGGGLPGLPLAIMFPNCSFLLVDSTGKKIIVVKQIIEALELGNAIAINERAENLNEKVDFVMGRAVSNISEFYCRVQHLISPNNKSKDAMHGVSAKGVIYLAGGDVEKDLGALKKKTTIYPIKKWFSEEYFETKKIIYVKR